MPTKCLNIEIIVCIVLFLAALFFVSPSMALAAISGEAELGYVSYDQEVNGVKRLDGSSFRQRYALRYDISDRLANGRLGGYKFSLGYEWSAINGKIKTPGDEESLDHTAGHILYNGLLVVDPKELPFRFKIYSGDLTRSVFMKDTSVIGAAGLMSSNAMITPGLDTAIIDGTHIRSGVTLEFGVKDSMSNRYNSVFNGLPMITLDYSDEINRDLKSINPVNSRLKKLAIASLNKKDNWVQFRSTSYKDYLNKEQNFDESQFLIGTVDPSMQRKWVHFSNWIQISADGSFTKHDDRINNAETYDVNLFGIATRSKWEARTFNSFSRILDNNGLRYETKLPLYINGVWGTETDWRARFSTQQIKYAQSVASTLVDNMENLASLRVDTFKRAPFTLSQEFLIDNYKNGSDNNLTVQGLIETASTRRFSSKWGLFASYKVRSLTSDNASSNSALNHDISARVVYTPISALRAELVEAVTIASGTGTNFVAPSVSGGNSGLSQINNLQLPSNSYNRYLTTARADWEPVARLRFGLIYVNEAIVAENRESIFSNKYGTNLDYQLKTLMVRLNANYTTTDTQGANSSQSQFAVDGSATYTPNRYMDASIRYNFSHASDFAGVKANSADLKQNANYYFYQVSGMARRILELNETLEYNKLNAGNNDNRLTRSLTLGARYYPLSKVYLAARIRYSLIDQPQHYDQLVYNGTIGFNFQKMQATIDYSYGDQSGTGNNRIEKRFEANLKKFF